jgi:hypothetical protein
MVDGDGVGVGGRVVGRGRAVGCGEGVEERVGRGDDDGLGDGVEGEEVVVVVEVGVVGVAVVVVLPVGLRVGPAAGGEEQADSRIEDSRTADSSTEVSRPLAAGLPTRWFDLMPPRCRWAPGEVRGESPPVPHWVPTVPPATASTRT